MEGDLALDSRSGWMIGGARGPAVVPGKPAESLLITAIRRTDPDLQMPPDEKLPDAKIAVLVDWIQRGAADPRINVVAKRPLDDPLDWWSLQPLQPVPVPATGLSVKAAGNPIDAFVAQRLQQAGLVAATRADRRTLMRRLYFDLHGLPPTPAGVEAFVADPDPLAYEKLVDRLLESPRYGERWARHWLDTVHFADSHGCEHDVFRPNAWRYRDYVIESFNRDTPWGRFIREQLAADYFYPDEPNLLAALGFIAAGPLELSRASTAPVTFDYLDRDDMVAQTMAAFTSTTANCARCHDHKFDPITQDDYYSLQAVFAGVGKGDVELDTDPRVAAARQRWSNLLTAATKREHVQLLEPEYADVIEAWESEATDRVAAWAPLVPDAFSSSGGATLLRLEDDSLLSTETRPDKDTYSITGTTTLNTLTALRLDVLVDERLPLQGPGRQDNGNLHLTEFEAFVQEDEASEPQRVKIRSATADWNQEGWTISHALDGNLSTAWGIYPQVTKSHFAVFVLDEPLELAAGSRMTIVLKQLHGTGHLIGRLKLYATDAANVEAEVLPAEVREALATPRDQRGMSQRTAIAAHVLGPYAEEQLAALPEPKFVYGVSRSYSHAKKLDKPMAPKVVHVLRRGNIDRPGEVAVPGALAAIASLPGRFELPEPDNEATRRAALADWLAAPSNPLTWRSIVNRVWAYHFGRGLCDTPNDFGRMGGAPSHPELLDWLAVWFRNDAQGSLKQLHRLILLSSAYQRQSRYAVDTSTAVEPLDPWSVDRNNRLLWRANRRPLDAESLRDAILQISGHMDWTMGGPGIQQFSLSKGVQTTPKLDYDAFDWNHPSAGRRSIYRVVWRGIADPFMEAWDFPDLGQLNGQRAFSVSSLQALATYNNDFVLHHSQQFAGRLMTEQESTAEQIEAACRYVYLREPTAREAALLVEYANRHGLAAACRVLFNSSEFIFVD